MNTGSKSGSEVCLNLNKELFFLDLLSFQVSIRPLVVVAISLEILHLGQMRYLNAKSTQ